MSKRIPNEGFHGEVREWHITITLWVNTELNFSCGYSASNHAVLYLRQKKVCIRLSE